VSSQNTIKVVARHYDMLILGSLKTIVAILDDYVEKC
jgi:hypothetical protein